MMCRDPKFSIPESYIRREVIIPADLMERMAFAHPGADIVLAADRAFLDLDGITYVSILAAVA